MISLFRSKSLQNSALVTTFHVLSWYATSLGLSLYNKWLFSPKYYNFKYPLFVTFIHNSMQVFISAFILYFFLPHLQPKRFPGWKNYLVKVVPCGLATGLDIGLSNNSLKSITLSFYTMVKSSVPVFVLIFAFLFRLEKPTVKLISVMAVIIFGVLLMVLKQTEFNMVGYIQVQLAAVSSGFRWALTQVLLEKESMGMSNPLATNIFLSPLMATSLLIASLSLENWYEMLTSPFFKTFDSTMHISAIIIFGGFLAFTMLICEFRLIAATSVVTFSVAGIFKEVLTISVSMIIFGDRLNTINIIGLVISIIGIGMYNYIRVVALLKARTDHTSSTLLISNADSTEFDPSTPEGTIQELIPGGYLPSSLVGYHPITELTSSPTYAHDETINADEYEDMELNDIEKELATSTKHNTQMPFRIGTLDSPRHKIID